MEWIGAATLGSGVSTTISKGRQGLGLMIIMKSDDANNAKLTLMIRVALIMLIM